MGQPAASGNFVHLYLNGLYWGVYNPIERPDATFLADRLPRHLFHDGIYTSQAAAELWWSLANQIKGAVVAESARWGD